VLMLAIAYLPGGIVDTLRSRRIARTALSSATAAAAGE
jgi:hypothetical protein